MKRNLSLGIAKVSGLLMSIASIAFAFMGLSCAGTQLRQAEPGQQGLQSLEYIELGGAKQLVLTRGKDKTKPILLYLHGGPGVPAIPYQHMLKDWEDDFLVVFYDQRGVGRSYPKKPETNITIDRYVRDAEELIDILLKRHGREKLYLIGHSWGSLLGLTVAGRIPEKLHAYMGIGQMISGIDNERRSYQWAVAKAKEVGKTKAIAQLGKLTPPYLDENGQQVIKELALQRSWLEKIGGVYYDYKKLGNKEIIGGMLRSKEYSIFDFANIELRGRAAAKNVWAEQMRVDFRQSLTRIEVPFYLCMGSADYNTPIDLAREYFESVVAPKGKTFIEFERSGHFPILEEKTAFLSALKNMAREIGGK